jgi:hypothetical protein
LTLFFQIDYLLDLGVTHVLNTAEAEVRIDPSKFFKNGICYKGFVCKVSALSPKIRQKLN